MSSRGRSYFPASSPPPLSSSSPTRRSTGSSASSDLRDEDACWKRLYFEEELNSGIKRKERDDKPAASTLQMGRGLRRVGDLWMDLPRAVLLSDQYILNKEADLVDPPLDCDGEVDENEVEARTQRKRANDFINVTDRTIHKFLDKVDSLADSPEESKAWLKTLQKGADNARAEDTHKISAFVATALNALTGRLKPDPVIDSESRENRGLKHDLCGLLLCPVELDWDDEEVRNNVRNYEEGFELGPTARALYANFTGDPTNLDAGYLKSKLLLKLYKFIFTSPSSAKSVALEESGDENTEPLLASKRRRTSQSGSRAPAKKDVATMLNMNNKVTPRSIAYAAVQLLFVLSSAERWGSEHEGLDFYDTYYHIVDHFEGDHNNGSEDLLKWWHCQVFPQTKRSATTSGARRARKLIEEQRAARSRAPQPTS